MFLTDVRVPDANKVGEIGSGWRAVPTTLMSERRSVGSGSATAAVDPANVLTSSPATSTVARPSRRAPAAAAHTNRRLLEWLGMRVAEAVANGTPLGAEGSIMKLLSNMHNRAIGKLAGSWSGRR